MLRIKLVRKGKKDRPTWRVVVVEKTKTGRGSVSDYIGSYDPNVKPKNFVLDIERYDHWVKCGAQPTDSILRLKGTFIDKTKEYQKVTGVKVYKSKKAEEEKPAAAPVAEKKTEEATETPEVVEEKVEEEKPVEEAKPEEKSE